ncbi:MAG: hypothetical protein H6621_02210 [Halobacteriovoraceae bacterium]|nr:hypothetical protein [Halobacteriovoraceae bacterium]MCB9093857.1 hypothetical protein [Halobacteriovoraceae bacterium]
MLKSILSYPSLFYLEDRPPHQPPQERKQNLEWYGSAGNLPPQDPQLPRSETALDIKNDNDLVNFLQQSELSLEEIKEHLSSMKEFSSDLFTKELEEYDQKELNTKIFNTRREIEELSDANFIRSQNFIRDSYKHIHMQYKPFMGSIFNSKELSPSSFDLRINGVSGHTKHQSRNADVNLKLAIEDIDYSLEKINHFKTGIQNNILRLKEKYVDEINSTIIYDNTDAYLESSKDFVEKINQFKVKGDIDKIMSFREETKKLIMT